MNHDGTEQVPLIRGGSPTWSPAGPKGRAAKTIAFHASASGAGAPVNVFPGSATEDSDIFVVNVDDLLENGAVPRNLTANRVASVDDDPNWSPDGRTILFTSYRYDPSTTVTTGEIFLMNADGTNQEQLTMDGIEKRGPAWSPDGTRILFACRMGPVGSNGLDTFEMCVMDAASRRITRLTSNTSQDLTPCMVPRRPGDCFSSNAWKPALDDACRWLGSAAADDSSGLNLLATSWGVIEVGRGRAVK